MKKILLTLAVLSTAVVLSPAAYAENGRIRARGSNGVAAAGSHNGNTYARARGHQQNADGSVTTASGGAYRGANGARGARASTTTVNPDGSASHQGGFAASGARGTVDSQGSATRDADGNVSGSRATNATGANGNSYSGATTYDSNSGVSHNATCRDASGAEIACPTR